MNFRLGKQDGAACSDADRLVMQSFAAPILIESYRRFNLVAFCGKVYAFAQSLGPTDLTQLDDEELAARESSGQCLRADTIAQARAKIDRITTRRMEMREQVAVFKARVRRLAGRLRRKLWKDE